MAKSIYRKTAIDRLSSPEQLDRLVPVTGSHGWLALLMLLAMIAAAVVWSFVGSLPSRVSGDGILLTAGGRVFQAVAPEEGVLEEITVRIDDTVERGETVAVLSQRALEVEHGSAVASMEDYATDLERVREEVGRTTELSQAAVEAQISATRTRIEREEQRLADAEKRFEDEQNLFDRGLSTNQRVIERQAEVDAIRNSIGDLRQRLADLEVSRFDRNVAGIERIQDAERALADARRRVAGLESRLERGSSITAPDAGRVTELLASAGEIVGRGESVVAFESLGEGLELVLYLPPQYGKSVERGMPVQISPTTAPREEYGTVVGTVTSISDFPSTVDGMMAVVRNSELVRQFSAHGPPYQAVVRLAEEPGSVSGYRWTSDRGEQLELRSGTLAEAEVTVRTQRPIELVIPLLREWTGL